MVASIWSAPAVLPDLVRLVLEAVDRNHGQAHVDLTLLPDLDAITRAIEFDAVPSDGRTVLQHGEGIFAGIFGQGRQRHRNQRRRSP